MRFSRREVDELLRNGANPNVGHPEEHGLTPIHFAARYDCTAWQIGHASRNHCSAGKHIVELWKAKYFVPKRREVEEGVGGP